MILLFLFLNIAVLVLSFFCIKRKLIQVLKYVGMLEVSFVSFTILFGLLKLIDFMEGYSGSLIEGIATNQSMLIWMFSIMTMIIIHTLIAVKAFLLKNKKGS